METLVHNPNAVIATTTALISRLKQTPTTENERCLINYLLSVSERDTAKISALETEINFLVTQRTLLESELNRSVNAIVKLSTPSEVQQPSLAERAMNIRRNASDIESTTIERKKLGRPREELVVEQPESNVPETKTSRKQGKLSVLIVKEILESEESSSYFSAKYNISVSMIHQIRKRNVYTYVDAKQPKEYKSGHTYKSKLIVEQKIAILADKRTARAIATEYRVPISCIEVLRQNAIKNRYIERRRRISCTD